VPLSWHRCALFAQLRVGIVPIVKLKLVSSPTRVRPANPNEWEVFYAIDAHLLRGNWLCGGPLDFPEGSIAGRGSRLTFSVTGPFVEVILGLGARPVAPPFRHRAPMRFLLREPEYVRQVRRLLLSFFHLSIECSRGLALRLVN
jgi:hypothetical protein